MGNLIESLRLRYSTGEPVQHVTVFAVILFKSVFNKTDYNLIGHERAFVDVLLRFYAERSTLLDVASEYISRGNVRNLVFLAYESRLSAFACAGCA